MNTVLKKIDFGNESADDVDPEDLVTYFVEQPSYAEFLDPRKKFLIAHARKGMGKSALLGWLAFVIQKRDPDAFHIKCKGKDLVRSHFKLTSVLSGPNEHIRDWMIRLCAMVNRQIALSVKIALTDDQMTLVETAELEGYKSRNLVGCLLDRLQSLLEHGGTKKLKAQDEIELLKRVKDRRVWIFIDDLDATFQNTKEELLSLATFFSACRYLTQEMKGIAIRVTLRTDVWPLIRRFDESLDKVEQYTREILWSQHDFLQLLALRIKVSMLEAKISLPHVPTHVSETDAQERLLTTVFSPKMEWNERNIDSYKVLYTLSYERPRWAVQLCKLAKEAALHRNAEFITKDHIDEVWAGYGKKRIDDLVAEHKHQCAQVEELVNAFRGADRLMARDGLFSWINNHVSQHIQLNIEGSSTRSPMDIAHFLYRIGFILARSDSLDSSNYEHYRFDQMPDFLTSRTENDFGLKWEIHPCYREALDIAKVDKSHRARFSRLRNRD